MGKEGINDFVEKLSNIDSELASRIVQKKEDKEKGKRILKELGLPTFKSVVIPLAEFRENPGDVIANATELGTGQYSVSLTSDIPGKLRLNKFPLTTNEITNFLAESVPVNETPRWILLLREYAQNIFGGNIIFGDDEKILVEIVPGEHSGLAHGRVTPKVFRSAAEVNRIPDRYLAGAVDKAIKLVKKGHRVGAYEFVLIKYPKKGDNNLRPIFLDYQGESLHIGKTVEVNSKGRSLMQIQQERDFDVLKTSEEYINTPPETSTAARNFWRRKWQGGD